MKDISEYLSFDETGGIPKRSIKSIVNLPVVVRRWKLMESKFRDGLAALGLSLNPKSTLHPLRHGVDFLKFKFRLSATGKVVRILNRRSPRRIQKRLKGLLRKFREGSRSWDDVLNCFNSWKAHAEQGNSRNKIRRIQQWLMQQS